METKRLTPSELIGLLKPKDYNKPIGKREPINYKLASIQPNSIVLYKQAEGYPIKDHNIIAVEKMQKAKKFNGIMSSATKSKIKHTINNLWSAVYIANQHFNIKNNKEKPYLTFITLTLSDSQQHTDQFIKRKMLNYFLIELKRKYGIRYYIWIAEKQKNGNIHFHIVVDKYIYHETVKHLWNHIQKGYRYLDNYKEKKGHYNPNSTDVKKINDNKGVGIYLSKYLSKENTSRKVEGRLWSASKEIRKLRPLILFDTDLSEQTKQYLYLNNSVNRYFDDNFTYFGVDTENILKVTDKDIYDRYVLHQIYNYSYLYPELKIEIKKSSKFTPNYIKKIEFDKADDYLDKLKED